MSRSRQPALRANAIASAGRKDAATDRGPSTWTIGDAAQQPRSDPHDQPGRRVRVRSDTIARVSAASIIRRKNGSTSALGNGGETANRSPHRTPAATYPAASLARETSIVTPAAQARSRARTSAMGLRSRPVMASASPARRARSASPTATSPPPVARSSTRSEPPGARSACFRASERIADQIADTVPFHQCNRRRPSSADVLCRIQARLIHPLGLHPSLTEVRES